MASSAGRGRGGWTGGALAVAVVCLCLGGLVWPFPPDARAQPAGDRWVTLATRDLDARAGHASIDLSKAKGAYRAVRMRVRVGALALTQIELKYHGGNVHTARRALILRQNQGPRLIDNRTEDLFLESLVLSFRIVAGEPERATLVIEGLQSSSGAVAVRSQPLAGGSGKKDSVAAAPPGPDDEQSKARRAKKGAARPAEKETPPTAFKTEPPPPAASTPPAAAPPPPGASQPPPVAAAPPPAGAAPPTPPATTRAMRNGAGAPPAKAAAPDPWDVVPVFYGTDRNRAGTDTRISYGSERARRLELGRALVTVPKAHEVPNVERPWVYRLPFTQIVLYSETEDPKRHFTLKDVRPLTKEEFLQLVRERLNPSSSFRDHALVFVHGFNSSFENALFRTAQIAYDIKFDGAPFLYSWPSKGALSTQDYSYDRESSGAAEPYLRQFLEVVARETGATSVSIIAHSMGNQLLLPVLRDLKQAAPPGLVISQVILAAPDVDRDAFENIAAELVGVSRGMTMLAAGNDRALDISRRFWGGVPRAGDVPSTGPIVVPGVDTIDVTAVSTLLVCAQSLGLCGKDRSAERHPAADPDRRAPARQARAHPRARQDRQGVLLALPETLKAQGAAGRLKAGRPPPCGTAAWPPCGRPSSGRRCACAVPGCRCC